MNLSSHLMQRALRLDPPQTRDLVVQPDLAMPMPDGVVLLSSPHGRRGAIAAGMAVPMVQEPGGRPEAH